MLKRPICFLVANVVAALAIGCAGGAEEVKPSVGPPPSAPADQQPIGPTNINPSTNPPTNGRSSAAPAKPDATAALPTIPAGAKFSIFCESYSTPDHVQLATNLKNLLARNSKLKDWYVIHQADQSSLYHGFYAEFDPKSGSSDKNLQRDAARAQRDHDLVESIPNPQAPDRKLFPRAIFVPLDSPDPDAPPAWNLTNAPGFWSVQIAAFNGPERKRQTIEAVKQARAEGIPAFYYHGPAVSSVCVGSWDRGAIKEQDATVPGSIDLDPGAREDSDLVVNTTGQDLGKQAPRVGPDGKPMRMLQVKTEILDKTLLDTLKQYPSQAVNGYEVPLSGTDANGNKVMRTRPSMIVMIPRADRAPVAANSQSSEPDPTLIRPGAGSSNLGARLRGIGQ